MSEKHFNKLKQVTQKLLDVNTIDQIDMSLQAAASELAIGSYHIRCFVIKNILLLYSLKLFDVNYLILIK